MRSISCKHVLALVSGSLLLTGAAHAAPILDITSPPVVNNGQTGPANDPSAAYGQWFKNVTSFIGSEPVVGSQLEHRKVQLHDNLLGDGGGGAGTDAIKGVITNVTTDAGLATSITIRASITNDTPPVGPWLDGSNTHGETLHDTSSYLGPLYDTKLTVNFADDGAVGNFPSGGAFVGSEPNIYATGYDELAWYSFTGTGGFYVPTYDFGTIDVGQTVIRDLVFGFYTPVDPTQFQTWQTNATDLFASRTTNLKISNYGSVLVADDGTAYPSLPAFSGNVSVFALPEPATLALFGVGFAGLAFGRKKA